MLMSSERVVDFVKTIIIQGDGGERWSAGEAIPSCYYSCAATFCFLYFAETPCDDHQPCDDIDIARHWHVLVLLQVLQEVAEGGAGAHMLQTVGGR
jgi:hypothetical protein